MNIIKKAFFVVLKEGAKAMFIGVTIKYIVKELEERL